MKALKIWNTAFTVFVFQLPTAVNYVNRKEGSPYHPEIHLPSMLPFLVVTALLWSLFTSRFFLPGLARGWVYAKNLSFMILQCYLATEATMLFHHYWIGALLSGKEVLALLGWGLVVHVWHFPFSVALVLLCLFVNGYVLKSLYRREIGR